MRKDILLYTNWRAFIGERIWHRIWWSWTIQAEESPVRVRACLLSPERVGTQAQPASPTSFLDSLVLVIAFGRSWTFGVSGEASSCLEFSPPSSCPVVVAGLLENWIKKMWYVWLALWLAGSFRQKASAHLAGPERKAGGRSFPWGACRLVTAPWSGTPLGTLLGGRNALSLFWSYKAEGRLGGQNC